MTPNRNDIAPATSGRKAIVIIAIAAAAVLVTAYVASPYWVFRQMQSAVLDGEPDRLSKYVDFPAVRESFKSQLMSTINRKLGDRSENPFAALGQMLANAWISPAVDAMVTPTTLAMMMKVGKAPALDSGRAPSAPASEATSSKRPHIVKGYEELDVFKVAIHDPDNDEQVMTFILHRNGLFGWKLTAVHLPSLAK